jgi:hypothetical protein
MGKKNKCRSSRERVVRTRPPARRLTLIALLVLSVAGAEFFVVLLDFELTVALRAWSSPPSLSSVGEASSSMLLSSSATTTTTVTNISDNTTIEPSRMGGGSPAPINVSKEQAKNILPQQALTEVHTAAGTSSTVRSCQCLQEVGTNGTWVQDFKFGKAYGQHPLPRNIPYGPHMAWILESFVPQRQCPVPWETSWRWEAAITSDTPPDTEVSNNAQSDDEKGNAETTTCDIDYTINSSPGKVCAALRRFDIGQVLFLGDSMQEYQYVSFINMLGSSSSLVQISRFSWNLLCSAQDDPIANTSKTESKPVEINFMRLKGGKSEPYLPHVSMSDVSDASLEHLQQNLPADPLLVVLNFGAHYHNLTSYATDVDYVVKLFQSWNRPEDLYFFRSTVPGHHRCLPLNPKNIRKRTKGQRDVPYHSYEEYARSSESNNKLVGHLNERFGWYLFEDYNEYAKRRVVGLFHMLDVVNMTVLRKDGHVAGQDCLHYRPGPGDWWNHLLFTQLQLLAQCSGDSLASKAP